MSKLLNRIHNFGNDMLRVNGVKVLPSVPGVVTDLATDFRTTEPLAIVVQQGSFVATTTNPRIEVEIVAQTTGVMHAPFAINVGPNVAFPLHTGVVSTLPPGVTQYPIGSCAGEYGRDSMFANIQLSGITIGQTVRWEILTGATGYGWLVSGFANGNTSIRITPNNQKLYVFSSLRVVPVNLGRSLENVPNTTMYGEYIPAIPYPFGGPNDACFKSDSSRGYVADWFGSAPGIVVFDVATDRVITNITGFAGISCDMSADDSKLYVATGSAAAGTIKEINTTTHAVTTHSLPVTTLFDAAIRVSPDGTKVAIACGDNGTSNRVYVYTLATWTLAQTFVIGGAASFPGKIAWEGNNVVWVPYPSLNNFYRCQVDTGQIMATPYSSPQSMAVTGQGLGKALFVASPSDTHRMAYYNLPSTHGTALVMFDGNNSQNLWDIELSSDDFIYQGTTDGRVVVNQGGSISINASNKPFWGERCKVSVFGGTP